MKDIKTILKEKKSQSVKLAAGKIIDYGDKPRVGFGISTAWQEKAFRYARDLGIVLVGSYKGRWLKVFLMASQGRKSANLERAYSYLKDHPKNFTDEHKIRFFFWIYEHGIDNSFIKTIL